MLASPAKGLKGVPRAHRLALQHGHAVHECNVAGSRHAPELPHGALQARHSGLQALKKF